MTLFPALAQRRQTNKRMRDLVLSRESKRGLLIAFEGPDGSGKTTQRKLFKNWLKSEGHDVVTTKWNSSELVKPLVKARKAARSLSPEEFSLLHAADFRYRLRRRFCLRFGRGRSWWRTAIIHGAGARCGARHGPALAARSLPAALLAGHRLLFFRVAGDLRQTHRG